MFAFNKSNHYTSVDVEHALRYGLKVELIQDDKPNFLYYSKDKLVNGAFLFKNYVKEFFEPKTQGLEGAKLLLNILWGALCQKNTFQYNIRHEDSCTLIDGKIDYLGFTKGHVEVKIIPYDKPFYLTDYARIKPFILSYGRYMCYKKFKDMEDGIIRVHTDGVLTYNEHNDVKLGEGLGEIKNKYYKNVEITGLNKLIKNN